MTGGRVLVADDDIETRLPMAKLLRNAGYRVWTAADGQEAVELVRAGGPDLVIADLLMPRRNGFELIVAVRADPRTSSVPVILISGWSRPSDRIRGLNLGADDFLVKPVDSAELLARVRAHLRRGRIESDLRRNSLTDELTGALNRRGVFDALERERARRTSSCYSVLLIDVDNFKAVNDRYGHAAGDAALRGLVHSLQTELRACDRVGRLGGDEILVILPDTNEDAALSLAERLGRRRRLTLTADGSVSIELSVSVGAATACRDESPDSVLRRADELMYRNKRGEDGAFTSLV